MPQRVFSQEFRERTVLFSYENGVKEAALVFSIHRRLIYRWREILNIPHFDQIKEIKRLQKEIRKKDIDFEILQGTSHIMRNDRKAIFEFMKEHQSLYPVLRMCKLLGLSSSSYYRMLHQKTNKLALENERFVFLIKKEFSKSKQRYGSARIAAKLQQQGHCISDKRVARLMRENGLKCRPRTKYVVTTDSNHSLNISPNLLAKEFIPSRLNEFWVSDITYIDTKQGWLYLTIIMDLYDRQIIGWELSQQQTTKKTILPAWEMASRKRNITQTLIFHSDRGSQYASNKFRKTLAANHHISQSMSRSNNCWDNAIAESFFKTLKSELIYHTNYKTVSEATLDIADFIKVWYNQERLHSSLGYKTPKEVELEGMRLG